MDSILPKAVATLEQRVGNTSTIPNKKRAVPQSQSVQVIMPPLGIDKITTLEPIVNSSALPSAVSLEHQHSNESTGTADSEAQIRQRGIASTVPRSAIILGQAGVMTSSLSSISHVLDTEIHHVLNTDFTPEEIFRALGSFNAEEFIDSYKGDIPCSDLFSLKVIGLASLGLISDISGPGTALHETVHLLTARLLGNFPNGFKPKIHVTPFKGGYINLNEIGMAGFNALGSQLEPLSESIMRIVGIMPSNILLSTLIATIIKKDGLSSALRSKINRLSLIYAGTWMLQPIMYMLSDLMGFEPNGDFSAIGSDFKKQFNLNPIFTKLGIMTIYTAIPILVAIKKAFDINSTQESLFSDLYQRSITEYLRNLTPEEVQDFMKKNLDLFTKDMPDDVTLRKRFGAYILASVRFKRIRASILDSNYPSQNKSRILAIAEKTAKASIFGINATRLAAAGIWILTASSKAGHVAKATANRTFSLVTGLLCAGPQVAETVRELQDATLSRGAKLCSGIKAAVSVAVPFATAMTISGGHLLWLAAPLAIHAAKGWTDSGLEWLKARSIRKAAIAHERQTEQ